MTNWNAGVLVAGYSKCIIGFDIRTSLRSYEKDVESSISKHIDHHVSKGKRVASFDNQVWPESIDIKWMAYQHGLNLFDRPLEQIDDIEVPANTVRVAFDLPLQLADTLISTFGIVPYPIKLVEETRNWKFIGFDIVDIRTQCSGIYSFDWSDLEFSEILTQFSLNLNRYGLVDDEIVAIKASVSFDDLVKEHAPFAPCGVWIKDREDENSRHG